MSELLRGRLTGFSLGRLLVFLIKLGHDVDITILPPDEDREGSVRLKSAAAQNNQGPFEQKIAGQASNRYVEAHRSALATSQI